MTTTARNRIIFVVVGIVAAAAAYWFLVLSPKQEEASALAAQVETAQVKLDETRRQVADLRAAKKTHDVDYASVVRLGKAVPTDDDVRSLVVQLDTAAKRSGVSFRTIQLSGGAGTSSAPTPAAAGAGTSQATTASLPPGASVGAAGFPTMPFNFEFHGQFFTLSNFFSRLERLVTLSEEQVQVSGRLLTVDAFTLKPANEGFPNVIATVGATAYLLPTSEGLPLASSMSAAAGATPVGAQPGATTPVTATSTGGIR